MNKPAINLILLILILMTTNRISAQTTTYRTNGGLTIGFGLGSSYQGSDTKNSLGAGFDFKLGSYLYKRDSAFLSVDWKFRFLAGENYAHDHRENTDGTYTNDRYAFFDYDLEIGLTLNRLLERTRIIVTGFAGVGMTHGRTFTDLKDANGLAYDYSAIDPSKPRADVVTELITLTDGDYETPVTNRGSVLPTAGIYIGYQFSRSFSIGIEHKINFSLQETDGVFGINIDNNIASGSPIDMNHYTSLGFRWSLGGRSSRTSSIRSYVRETPSPIVHKPLVTEPPVTYARDTAKKPPRITRRPLTTTRPVATTRPPVTVTRPLTMGKPPVTTTNPTTTRPVQTAKPAAKPVVRFVNPQSPVTVEKNVFSLRIQTENVAAWQDVRVMVNGVYNSNFSLTPAGLVTLNIGLREGQNTVEVTARNASGESSASTGITFKKPEVIPLPTVSIQVPGSNPLNTYEPFVDFQALVTGVNSKDDISLVINGKATQNFSYNSNSFIVASKVSLNEGRNVLRISASNKTGEASDNTVIVKEMKPCPAPELRLIEPAGTRITTDKQNFRFRIEAMNITGSNQVSLTFNGRSVAEYTLSGSVIDFNTSLKEGVNSLTIQARNECNTSVISSSVTYTPPVIIEQPCVKPSVEFNIRKDNTGDSRYRLNGKVTDVKQKSDISFTVNGAGNDNFNFQPSTGAISSVLDLSPGSYTMVVTARNECGTASRSASVNVEAPCHPPKISFTVSEIEATNATHEIRGTATEVSNKNDIRVLINGGQQNNFSFNRANGALSARIKLQARTNNIKVSVKNGCGEDSKTVQVVVKKPVEEAPCGVRINPGNSSWEFCLVTPGGTYTRDNLQNQGFTYSGPASSLFFKPIAGGGNATVNGSPYTLKSGQYYLFTGSLNVTVSTKNPGSMGQWSVCITANRAPVTGNGNNRPQSPCQDTDSEGNGPKPKKH